MGWVNLGQSFLCHFQLSPPSYSSKYFEVQNNSFRGIEMRTYEPNEFVSLLASSQLDEPIDLALYGLVKADENDSSMLLFSISSLREQWIPIPVSLISSIQHIRNVYWKDHQHPLVKLVLAEPKKEDVSAVLFMRLFAQTRAVAARMKTFSGSRARMRMQNECEVLEFDDVPYLCCGGECWILL